MSLWDWLLLGGGVLTGWAALAYWRFTHTVPPRLTPRRMRELLRRYEARQ